MNHTTKTNEQESSYCLNPSSLNSSEVEYTLTLSCFLNAFSSDHIAQFNDNARAKYAASLICGAKSLASERKDSYSDFEIIFILPNKSSATKSSSEGINLEYSNNLFLLVSISSNKYCGECKSNPPPDKDSNKSKVKLLLINAENKTFASTIKIIYNNPCLLAMPDLTSSASFSACFSVNSLLESISLATENFNFSTNSLTTLSSALPNLLSKLCGTSNLTITSAILTSQYNHKQNYYLNLSPEIGNFGNAIRESGYQRGQSLLLLKDGNVGIGTTGPASTLTVVGNFSATGTKSAVVNTSYGIRKLYAMESPDIRFYDQGRASLTNGIANISLDPIFIETVEHDYIVYLTPEANTITEKEKMD